MNSILIVDDDVNLRASLERILVKEGYHVSTAASGAEALERIDLHRPDLMICDVQMPGMTGLELFERLHTVCPGLPVIIITAYRSSSTAIEANRLGAVEYLRKPFDPADLMSTIARSLAAARQRDAAASLVPADAGQQEGLLGDSKAMYHVYQSIGRVAATEVPVLIRGETGTGKELVAQAIHRASGLRGPFLALNCVAIPRSLLESELFGHEKGAFTGAAARRLGKFELAAGGTLFLDEIGDMDAAMQGPLLRVLQERQFERVGGQQSIATDVRVLAATNADLEAGIAHGRFRGDLYQRLNGVTIWLPPLRERVEDVLLLARHFLQRFSRELGLAAPSFSPAAEQLLQKHPWPGNVRELARVLQRALILNRDRALDEDELSDLLAPTSESAGNLTPVAPAVVAVRVGMTLEQAECELIRQTLAATGGNKTEAARLLGTSRNALYEKLRRHGISDLVLKQDTPVS